MPLLQTHHNLRPCVQEGRTAQDRNHSDFTRARKSAHQLAEPNPAPSAGTTHCIKAGTSDMECISTLIAIPSSAHANIFQPLVSIAARAPPAPPVGAKEVPNNVEQATKCTISSSIHLVPTASSLAPKPRKAQGKIGHPQPTMNNLPSTLQRVFKDKFVPSILMYFGSMTDPWARSTGREKLATDFQPIWDHIFPNHPHHFTGL